MGERSNYIDVTDKQETMTVLSFKDRPRLPH